MVRYFSIIVCFILSFHIRVPCYQFFFLCLYFFRNAEDGSLMTTFKFGNELTDQQLGCLWCGETMMSINLTGDISFLDELNPERPFNVIQVHFLSFIFDIYF